MNHDLRPDETEPRRPARPVRVVAAGLIVLVILNLVAAAYLQRYPVNPTDHRVAEKWDLVDDPGGAVDWIIVGDSSCNQGIDPEVVEATLGGRAVNLCTTGNLLAVEDAWALGAYLDKHPAPAGVIVGHVPDVWIRQADVIPTSLVRTIAGLDEASRVQAPRVDVDEIPLGAFGARWVPMWSRRSSLQKLVRTPSLLFTERPASASGFFGDPDDAARPSAVRSDADGHLAALDGRTSDVSDANEQALIAIDELARTHDFDVYVVTSPMYEDLWAAPDYRAWVRATVDAVVEITERLGRVRMTLCDPITFPATLMNNADHVTITAARDYSAIVAAAVAGDVSCHPGDREPR